VSSIDRRLILAAAIDRSFFAPSSLDCWPAGDGGGTDDKWPLGYAIELQTRKQLTMALSMAAANDKTMLEFIDRPEREAPGELCVCVDNYGNFYLSANSGSKSRSRSCAAAVDFKHNKPHSGPRAHKAEP
jgi:hypothetical protein